MPAGSRFRTLLLASILLATSSSRAAPEPMQPIYNLDRSAMPHIDAVEYTLKDEALHIFSVPQRHAVGTNAFRNAITLLDLSGPKVKYTTVLRNFTQQADAGSMVFLPRFSDDTIGYSQTRLFHLLDLKAGRARRFTVGRFIEDEIKDVAVIDWEKRLFLFNVDFLQWSSRQTDLLLFDLSGPEPKQVASFAIKRQPYWANLGRTTFFFTEENGQQALHALDDRLRPTPHPLVRLYRESALILGDPELPTLHPTLPFAVFASEPVEPPSRLTVWLASWTNDGVPAVNKVSESVSGDFQFSPDGKWLVFLDGIRADNRILAMPVDPALPHVLGPPILLRTGEVAPADWNGNCAWISDPTSVVCRVNYTEKAFLTGEERDRTKLLKWELPPANTKR